MSTADYNKIKTATLQDLLQLDVHIVVEWLQNQHQAVGEAVAKACYQAISEAAC